MKTMVEFCISNLAAGAEITREKLETDPELVVEVLEYGCLGHCGECFVLLFALVDGELVQGENPDDLYQKIKGHIQDREQREKEWDEIFRKLDHLPDDE